MNAMHPTRIMCLTLLVCLMTPASMTSAFADETRARSDGGPNQQFADLLNGPIFNARFDDHIIPFGKEISIEVVVDHRVGNAVRGTWGRGVVRATRVDGKPTDESLVRFFITPNEHSKGTLEKGRRYTLVGAINHGITASSRVSCSFTLSKPPESIAENPQVPQQRVMTVGLTVNADGNAGLKTESRVFPLNGVPPWKVSELDKTVRVSGTLDRDNVIDVISVTFPKLDDFVGQDVELKGTMWSLNGKWWFEHSDQKVVVSKLKDRPGGDLVSHGYEMQIKGNLTKELRPSLDQISLKTCRDLVPHFVLKKAHLELVSHGEASQFFDEIHDQPPTFSDGVLELHDEYGRVYNIMPSMNGAMLRYQRNAVLIAEIIRRDSPETRGVIENRMEDVTRPIELRLLDAGILAAMNDQSGRAFLLRHLESRSRHLDSVCWVIGNLHEFAPVTKQGDQASVDMTWAEQSMIGALTDTGDVIYNKLYQESQSAASCQTMAIQFGGFHHRLVELESERGIQHLCRLVAQPGLSHGHVIVSALLGCDHGDVVKLVESRLRRKGEWSHHRQQMQAYLLRHRPQVVIDDLIDSIEKSQSFRTLMGLDPKRVLDRLRARLPTLADDQQNHARVLMLLLSGDPGQALLREMKKQDGIGRNLSLYWLLQHKSIEVAEEVASILKTAPAEFFNEGEFTNTLAVQRAIEVCQLEGETDSIAILISLLNADFDRFDVYTTKAECHNFVAAKLIELTDVSFGVDQAKWESWYQQQRNN